MEKVLNYKKCASNWNEALPLGNGFMGAMCYGGPLVEKFQLNTDSLWYGGPKDRINPDALNYLSQIRENIFAGKIPEAEALCDEALCGVPDFESRYEPLGDVFLFYDELPGSAPIHTLFGIRDGWHGTLTDMGEAKNYERELDLFQGLYRVSYAYGNAENEDSCVVEREAFISNPSGVMAIKTKGCAGRIIAERKVFSGTFRKISEDTLCMEGQAGPDGVKYCLCIRVLKGNAGIIGKTVHIEKEAEILLTSETTFYCENPVEEALRKLEKAAKKGYEALKKEHCADFSELMNRCYIELSDEESGKKELTIPERLERVKEGEEDNGLLELSFHYGRYLMISGSRKGSLPLNLQGIWNQDFLPPWDSKYTININAQMNYWPAEITNLSELHEPFMAHMKRMLPSGRECAKRMYGVNGFMAHHNTDIWGDCAPVDTHAPASYWQLGAAWMCLHVMEHYRYTGDREHLEEYLPILREAALFFEESLCMSPSGERVICPSLSPENTYRLPDGTTGTLCFGATMDSQILRAFFEGLLEVTSKEEPKRKLWENILRSLPKEQVGPLGTVLEWSEDYEETEIGHRHISHLFGLYPGKSISDEQKELMEAARKTLYRRLSEGGGHTGWSRAWIINMWSRLRDGKEVSDHLTLYLQKSVLPNLFDNHPPFQIDGNFGVTAGIAEALLQSHETVTEEETELRILRFLPALPVSFQKGHVAGLRARGGITADLWWEKGRLTRAVLISDRDICTKIYYNETSVSLNLSSGKPFEIKG